MKTDNGIGTIQAFKDRAAYLIGRHIKVYSGKLVRQSEPG